jgi:serine/threonine protein kinase
MSLWSLVDAGGAGRVWNVTDRVLESGQGGRIVIKTYEVPEGDEFFGPRFVAETRGVARIAHRRRRGAARSRVRRLRRLGGDAAGTGSRCGPASPVPARFPPPLAMAWLGQAASAMAEVQPHGHRPSRAAPSRLFVRSDERMVLTEFGAPRGMDRLLDAPEYLSPEEAKGEQPATYSDIYQLGLIAYACLAGRPPFLSENPLEVAMMHVRHEPPPLPDHVPGPVQRIVWRCLAKSPATAGRIWRSWPVPPSGSAVIQAGTRLDDRYVLEDVVGRGRLGEVWRAHDTTLGRVLAVSSRDPRWVTNPASGNGSGPTLGPSPNLRDPNIVDVYDSATSVDTPTWSSSSSRANRYTRSCAGSARSRRPRR